MPHHHFTSRDFNHDPTGAKRAAQQGPVYITDRGKPSHVLLSIEQYNALTGSDENIVDMLAMAEDAPDFDPKPIYGPLTKPVDLS